MSRCDATASLDRGEVTIPSLIDTANLHLQALSQVEAALEARELKVQEGWAALHAQAAVLRRETAAAAAAALAPVLLPLTTNQSVQAPSTATSHGSTRAGHKVVPSRSLHLAPPAHRTVHHHHVSSASHNKGGQQVLSSSTGVMLVDGLLQELEDLQGLMVREVQ